MPGESIWGTENEENLLEARVVGVGLPEPREGGTEERAKNQGHREEDIPLPRRLMWVRLNKQTKKRQRQTNEHETWEAFTFVVSNNATITTPPMLTKTLNI